MEYGQGERAYEWQYDNGDTGSNLMVNFQLSCGMFKLKHGKQKLSMLAGEIGYKLTSGW